LNSDCNPWHLGTETFTDSGLVAAVVEWEPVAGVGFEVDVVVMNPRDN